jgi:hypothetical protein
MQLLSMEEVNNIIYSETKILSECTLLHHMGYIIEAGYVNDMSRKYDDSTIILLEVKYSNDPTGRPKTFEQIDISNEPSRDKAMKTIRYGIRNLIDHMGIYLCSVRFENQIESEPICKYCLHKIEMPSCKIERLKFQSIAMIERPIK